MNITSELQRYEGLAFSVTHSGGQIALRVATRKGIVFITGPLANWLEATRSDADANGLPWDKQSAPAVATLDKDSGANMKRLRGERRKAATESVRKWLTLPPASRPSRGAAAGKACVSITLWNLSLRHEIENPGQPRLLKSAGSKIDPAMITRYREAWAIRKKEPKITWVGLAKRVGVSSTAVTYWCKKFDGEAAA